MNTGNYSEEILKFAWAILDWKPNTQEEFDWFLNTTIGDILEIDPHCNCCSWQYELGTKIDIDGKILLDNLTLQLEKRCKCKESIKKKDMSFYSCPWHGNGDGCQTITYSSRFCNEKDYTKCKHYIDMIAEDEE